MEPLLYIRHCARWQWCSGGEDKCGPWPRGADILIGKKKSNNYTLKLLYWHSGKGSSRKLLEAGRAEMWVQGISQVCSVCVSGPLLSTFCFTLIGCYSWLFRWLAFQFILSLLKVRIQSNIFSSPFCLHPLPLAFFFLIFHITFSKSLSWIYGHSIMWLNCFLKNLFLIVLVSAI